MRSRIPYVPVHIDSIARENLKVLVLPNIAAMSDAQCAAVRKFVADGGALVATGASSLYDQNGDPRGDYGLADVYSAHFTGTPGAEKAWATQNQHTYLRLTPGLTPGGHPVLSGFDETAILPYGGSLEPLRTDAGAVVPLTFIPPFPVLPPETSWMRTPKTDIPGLVLMGRRVAFLPADIDRRYAREPLPDYANLLANIVRWAANDAIPLDLQGPGLFDCGLYTQPGRVIAHLVNLTVTGRMPIDELIPVGPLKFAVRLPDGVRGRAVKLLVLNRAAACTVSQGWARVEVPPVLDHEVLVIE
jgi:hypothetical protein